MMGDLAKELKELKSKTQTKETRLHQVDGEIASTERRMKEEYGTTPDKLDDLIEKMKKQEEQLRSGIEKGLVGFREKYSLGNE